MGREKKCCSYLCLRKDRQMDMDSRIKAKITKKKENRQIQTVYIDQFSNGGPAQSHALIDAINQ